MPAKLAVHRFREPLHVRCTSCGSTLTAETTEDLYYQEHGVDSMFWTDYYVECPRCFQLNTCTAKVDDKLVYRLDLKRLKEEGYICIAVVYASRRW